MEFKDILKEKKLNFKDASKCSDLKLSIDPRNVKRRKIYKSTSNFVQKQIKELQEDNLYNFFTTVKNSSSYSLQRDFIKSKKKVEGFSLPNFITSA